MRAQIMIDQEKIREGVKLILEGIRKGSAKKRGLWILGAGSPGCTRRSPAECMRMQACIFQSAFMWIIMRW